MKVLNKIERISKVYIVTKNEVNYEILTSGLIIEENGKVTKRQLTGKDLEEFQEAVTEYEDSLPIGEEIPVNNDFYLKQLTRQGIEVKII